jgi:hypothetical protein
MTHPRKTVRNAVINLLFDVDEFYGRVYSSRVYPVQPSELPCAIVHTDTENSEPMYEGGSREYSRQITLAVEIICYGGDDEVDDLCSLAEQVIENDQTLDGFAQDCYLASTQITQSGDNQKPTVVARLEYQVTVFKPIEE